MDRRELEVFFLLPLSHNRISHVLSPSVLGAAHYLLTNLYLFMGFSFYVTDYDYDLFFGHRLHILDILDIIRGLQQGDLPWLP